VTTLVGAAREWLDAVRSYDGDSSATPRNGAGGRKPTAKEGATQKDRFRPTISGVCAGKEAGTVSPGGSRVRKALRTPWFPLGWGAEMTCTAEGFQLRESARTIEPIPSQFVLTD
jgi:hypothetical protein